MNQRRSVLKRLHQVRLDGIQQNDRHRTRTSNLFGRNSHVTCCVSNNNATKSRPKVFHRSGQCQQCHHFRSSSDVKTRRALNTVFIGTLTNRHTAQGTIIDIKDTLPCDFSKRKPQRVALVKMIINHGREQVMCSSNCMEIASEMQIQNLHRNHLAVPTACCTTLDAKRWPH